MRGGGGNSKAISKLLERRNLKSWKGQKLKELTFSFQAHPDQRKRAKRNGRRKRFRKSRYLEQSHHHQQIPFEAKTCVVLARTKAASPELGSRREILTLTES